MNLGLGRARELVGAQALFQLTAGLPDHGEQLAIEEDLEEPPGNVLSPTNIT